MDGYSKRFVLVSLSDPKSVLAELACFKINSANTISKIVQRENFRSIAKKIRFLFEWTLSLFYYEFNVKKDANKFKIIFTWVSVSLNELENSALSAILKYCLSLNFFSKANNCWVVKGVLGFLFGLCFLKLHFNLGGSPLASVDKNNPELT